MILTIDIGNSRIKWALWQAEKIIARGAACYELNKIAEAFDQLFSAIEKPSQVFAVCVAGNEIPRVLSEWVKQKWQRQVDYLKTEKHYKNITNAYDQPEQHGADRWAAIIAGFQRFPGSAVCVISAGTAITFDLINKDGRHLGGYILPSYLTMHAALMADTANVTSELTMQFKQNNNSSNNVSTIPDNTNDAVNQGLHKLLQAGIREFCQLAQQTMAGPVQIIITGGFAKTILSYPGMPEMIFEPDLVMQGLYNIMQHNTSKSRNSETDI